MIKYLKVKAKINAIRDYKFTADKEYILSFHTQESWAVRVYDDNKNGFMFYIAGKGRLDGRTELNKIFEYNIAEINFAKNKKEFMKIVKEI